jgi:hypothetical protein
MMAAVPLILHAAYGSIPEGVTYLMKAALEGGGAYRILSGSRGLGLRAWK